MNQFKPVIDPEFKNLLPPHTKEELAQLEKNVLADPKHESMPRIIVWPTPEGDVVVDGNNQYALRQKNGLAIDYVAKDFPNRTAALLFALDVQFGRRNLLPSQRALIVANLPRLSVGKPGANSANLPNYAGAKGANLPNYSVDELANLAGVSPRTVKSATKVNDKAVPEIVAGVRDGRFKVSDAAAVVNLPAEVQQQIAEKAMKDGVTLSRAAKPSAGISFDPEELELAIAATPIKPSKNGASVVSGKDCENARQLLSKLVRAMYSLGLYDKHESALSEMIRDVKALQNPAPPRYPK